MKINIHHVYRIFQGFFRKKRMKVFTNLFNLNNNTRIIDVDGTPFNWSLIPIKPEILIINIFYPKSKLPDYKYIVADGKNLPFKDFSFDIAYSNSVIEHLSTKKNQVYFSNEIRRVGIHYYIQTPNKNFPIEPHYLTPIIHYFTRQTQKKLLRYLSVWGWITKPSKDQIEKLVDEINLLSADEMKVLFPDATISFEKAFFLNKSIIAIRNSGLN